MFQDFSVGGKLYRNTSVGVYMASDVVAGGPRDYIRITPGTRNPSLKQTICAVTRVLEITDAQGLIIPASGSIQFRIADGHASDVLDVLSGSLSEFLTPQNSNDILLGKR